jgi:pentatricopeptide repeat protein
MQSKGFKPNRVTYNILIKAAIERPDEQRDSFTVEHALAYFNQMKRQKVRPTKDTWYILLSGLTKRDEWERALTIVREMKLDGFEPTGGLKVIVDNIKRRAQFGI